MPLWSKTGTKPKGYHREFKRDIVATDIGWVKRKRYTDEDLNVRVKDEVLVDLTGLANSTNMGAPGITDVWFSTTSVEANTEVKVYVAFDEPVVHANNAGDMKMNIANTAGGAAAVAVHTANSFILNAENTLEFSFTPTVAGTYSVAAQTIANNTATAINLDSKNDGGENANVAISAGVAADVVSLTVTA